MTPIVLRNLQGASSLRALFISKNLPDLPLSTSNRILSMTSALGIKANRGPFTPDEKKLSSHLVSASVEWKSERILSLALLGVFPVAFFMDGPAIDHTLSLSIALHAHWGMQHVIQDYLTKFVPRISILLYVVSCLTFAGLIHFNYNDVGLTRAIQMFWSL